MTGPPKASAVAEVAAERAATVPGVARLDAGPLHTKATYGVGSRIDGVTVRSADERPQVTVHVAVAFGEPIPELAERVDAEVGAALRRAFPGVAGDWTVGLDVVDVVLPGDATDDVETLPGAGRRELL